MHKEDTLRSLWENQKVRFKRKRPWIRKVELKVKVSKDGNLYGSLNAKSNDKNYFVTSVSSSTENLMRRLMKKILRKTGEDKKRNVGLSHYLEVL
ncbi:MAG: hypothetical protein K9K67_03825 [Bacteriovoracaceae bacterium]|nr:hypothetical protein [Bacteriovoracaceae bacterium]